MCTYFCKYLLNALWAIIVLGAYNLSIFAIFFGIQVLEGDFPYVNEVLATFGMLSGFVSGIVPLIVWGVSGFDEGYYLFERLGFVTWVFVLAEMSSLVYQGYSLRDCSTIEYEKWRMYHDFHLERWEFCWLLGSYAVTFIYTGLGFIMILGVCTSAQENVKKEPKTMVQHPSSV